MSFEIVEPYARPLNILTQQEGIGLLRNIEWIGRISHRSEEKQTTSSWTRFINSVVMERGDWSITEHASVTVDALVDRGISHEWVRHRIGAYTQESTRFVNYLKTHTGTEELIRPFKFIRPKAFTVGLAEELTQWEIGRTLDIDEYNLYIRAGHSPQIARNCLPNCLATRLIATYNLRMWRHFFLMRTCQEAHPQMKEVTIPLLQEFQRLFPIIYDDISPSALKAVICLTT